MLDLKKDSILLCTEKSIKNNFLVIKNVNINVQSYEFKILQEEKNKSLLQPKLDYEGESMILKYDISNKISLDDYIKSNKLKCNDLKTIVKAINNMLNEIEIYLVSENSILLDTKSIYIDKRRGRCNLSFVPVPDYKSDFSFELSKLLIRLMRFVDVNDKETLALAYGLFIKSSKDNFTINDLMELCVDIDEGDSNDIGLEEEFNCLYDGKIIEENEFSNNYNAIDENLSIINSEDLYENDYRKNKVSNIKENDYNYQTNTGVNISNEISNIDEMDNENDEDTLLDDIKIESKAKRMILDYFDDEDEAIKNDNHIAQVSRKKKRLATNRQRLAIDTNMVKKVAMIMLFVVPIVASILFGGIEFFYNNFTKILFFEIFLMLFMIINSILNRFIRPR